MNPLKTLVVSFGIAWLGALLVSCSSVDREPDGVPVFLEQKETYRNRDGVVWTCKRYPIRNLQGVVLRVEEICK